MNVQTFATHTLMDITARPPIVFVKGEGSWLWDQTGKRYLDFVQGWAVNCLGHSPPAVADAVSRQAQQLRRSLARLKNLQNVMGLASNGAVACCRPSP